MSADVTSVGDVALRFGDWGPGYISQTPDAAFGTVVLRPGDVFENHLHEHHTESFVALEGVAEVWIDRAQRAELRAGDVLHATAGEEHLLRNTGAVPFRAVFVKTPWVDGDKVERPWRPDPQD